MKHKFDSYSITDIIDLLDTMVGNTVQIKTILEKE